MTIMKRMLRMFLCLYVFVLVFSCKTTRVPSEKAQWKSIYVDQFKLTYVRKVLLKSYNNSKAIKEIIDLDHSGFTEPILTTEDYKLIDSLVEAENEKMKVDSVDGDRRAEGAQGKRPFQFILNTLKDRSLEKLAKRRFKNASLLDNLK
jgi:hypothetical protein